MFQQRARLIQQKIAELTQKANQLYGITLPHIELQFNIKGTVAGYAQQRNGQYKMRFNQVMMLNEGWDHIITDTVPHELAHIVCFFKPSLGRNHNYGWQRVCIALGGNGKRCHNEEVSYAHGSVYYTSTTGFVIPVSNIRHQKIQRGQYYIFRNGKGQLNRQCAYAYNANAAPAIAPVQHTTRIANPQMGNGRPKSEQVREQIRRAKLQGADAEVVILWSVHHLNMTRSLARVYVTGNWNKV